MLLGGGGTAKDMTMFLIVLVVVCGQEKECIFLHYCTCTCLVHLPRACVRPPNARVAEELGDGADCVGATKCAGNPKRGVASGPVAAGKMQIGRAKVGNLLGKSHEHLCCAV
jgi:hypothetical protein